MWLLLVFISVFIGLYLLIDWLYRRPYINGYTHKSVFITGTDSGFGFELALDLDKKGVKVYAGCYTKEGAANLQSIASDRLKTIDIDITNKESVIRAREAIEKDLQNGQQLWGLVNNAGILTGGYVFCLSRLEDYRTMMEVNFFGTINVTQTFSPLIQKSAGRIVNVISIAGRCSGGMEPYTCSKHAMEPFSDGLRRWMQRYGAHVAIIEPGSFRTTNLIKNFTQQFDDYFENQPQELKKEFGDEFMQAMKDDIEKSLNVPIFHSFNPPTVVLDDIKHGLFAKHPKDRYVCGVDAKYAWRFLPFLPDWFIDFIVYFTFPYHKLDPK